MRVVEPVFVIVNDKLAKVVIRLFFLGVKDLFHAFVFALLKF